MRNSGLYLGWACPVYFVCYLGGSAVRFLRCVFVEIVPLLSKVQSFLVFLLGEFSGTNFGQQAGV